MQWCWSAWVYQILRCAQAARRVVSWKRICMVEWISDSESSDRRIKQNSCKVIESLTLPKLLESPVPVQAETGKLIYDCDICCKCLEETWVGCNQDFQILEEIVMVAISGQRTHRTKTPTNLFWKLHQIWLLLQASWVSKYSQRPAN